MDQGAIETLKRRYRRKLLGKIIDTNDEEEPKDIIATLKEVTIKDVIYMTAAAWDEVTPIALNKTWKKVWPGVPSPVSNTNETIGESDEPDDDGNILEMLQTLDGGSEIQLEDVSEWVQGDEVPHPTLTEDDIVAACSTSQQTESDGSDDGYHVEEKKGPSHTEATKMFEDLMLYMEQQDDTSPAELLLMKRLGDRAARKRSSSLKQKKISNFFKKLN